MRRLGNPLDPSYGCLALIDIFCQGDRHLLIVDRDRWVLFELYAARWNSSANRWEAASGAIFDLNSLMRRPDGWTSADAAGLAILPGLVRYDEANSGRDIPHAFRVTVRATNGYVWPASHSAGSRDRTSFGVTNSTGAPAAIFCVMRSCSISASRALNASV